MCCVHVKQITTDVQYRFSTSNQVHFQHILKFGQSLSWKHFNLCFHRSSDKNVSQVMKKLSIDKLIEDYFEVILLRTNRTINYLGC